MLNVLLLYKGDSEPPERRSVPMSKNLGLIVLISVCFLGAPNLFAEEGAVAEALASATVEATPTATCFEEFLEDPIKVALSGCTASYNCIHGGTVSCSSPLAGTCTSSGQRCGRVTCNGQTTWCAGACQHAFHCASFCNQQGSTDGYCDSFGCCVCL